MHNGQIGGYGRIRRRVEALIDDRAYDARLGTSDSEAIFLAALSGGLAGDPAAAYSRVLQEIVRLQREQGIRAPVRFAACHTDGRTLHAFRWASDDRSPSLYLRRLDEGVVIASEPYDDARDAWEVVPPDRALTVGTDGMVRIERFGPGVHPGAGVPEAVTPEARSA